LVDEVVCFVDHAPAQGAMCLNQLYRWKSSFENMGPSIGIYPQQTRRGIIGNTILAMKEAFDGGAENVLMLEDDAVLKPDALRLANWFCETQNDDFLAFSLAAHDAKGGIKADERPESIAEYNLLTCPFAYVVRKQHWPFLLKNWCCKDYHPCGWSWSMTYAARFEGLKFMAPWLSRCENIGREMGTNESPESWDKTQTGITFSDGSYRGKYALIRPIDEETVRRVDEWMLNEINKVQAAKADGWLGLGCPPEIEAARKELCGQ
jgi:hypothetical protein